MGLGARCVAMGDVGDIQREMSHLWDVPRGLDTEGAGIQVFLSWPPGVTTLKLFALSQASVYCMTQA